MYSIIMQRIYFRQRRDASRAPFVIVAVALLCMAVFLIAMNKDNIINLTGFAVSEAELAAQEKHVVEISENAYIAEDKTPEGLVLKYGSLEQGIAEIGLPVKWEQEIIVENPTNNPVKNARLSFFVPKDAKNIAIFLNEKKISSGVTAVIPEVKPKNSIILKITFETSPVMMEFIEENGETRVRVWQDSGMVYRNIPIEMDIKLGEQIVESAGGAEKDIVFNYASGKARWTIGEI